MVSGYVKEGVVAPFDPPPYPIMIFDSMSRFYFYIVSHVFGINTDVYVIEMFLDLLVSLCHLTTKACTKFDFPQFFLIRFTSKG